MKAKDFFQGLGVVVAMMLGILGSAQMAHAQQPENSQVYVLLAAWYAPAKSNVTGSEPRQFTTAKSCMDAAEVLAHELQGRTLNLAVGCGVLDVPKEHFEKVQKGEADHPSPKREPKPSATPSLTL